MSTRVHIDQIMICLGQHCPDLERLEIQWDPDTIRYSDNSSKFIDMLRYCQIHLKLTLFYNNTESNVFYHSLCMFN